jgi:outer membrane protein assembly factor BamB
MINLHKISARRIVPLVVAVVFSTSLRGADWLQFRGNNVSGVSALSAIPATWSDTENVAWKVDLPGRGASGAIVIGNQVVVTASSGFRQDRLHVLSFDRVSGKKVWERQFWATGRTMTHPKMSVATPTPASDGERIFAFYSSNDVVCLDLDGNLQWLRGLTHDFPNASNSLGMSSSPIVIGDTLIVQVENDAESFAAGLDTSNGKSRWKKVRPKKANWTSPTLWQEGDAAPMALLQSSAGIEAVHPRTGETIWKFGAGASTIPSSVVTPDSLLIPSNGLTAVRLGDKVDDEAGSPEVLWNDRKLGPGTSSPIVVAGKVFVVNRAGVLQAADVNTGSLLWRLRLKGPFSATPVAAGQHLIFFNEKGDAQVVDISGAEGEIVGENTVGETILSTPAIADNEMFVRSDGHLWKIAK